jgi:phage tail-like protein
MRAGFEHHGDGDGAARGDYRQAGAVSIGSLLPGIYQEYDDNAMRFTAALDAVLAPVWLAIDCFDAYLSPDLAPDDMAAWLATWVGIAVDENWHPDQLRRLLTQAFDLYRWRGTVKGMADLVEAHTGLRPRVTDSGGVAVSATPGGAMPGPAEATVVVGIPALTLDQAELERLASLVRVSTPAHVTARLEVA